MMDLEQLENTLYLVRMNLYDEDGDWRTAKVVMIANNTITLQRADGKRHQWNIDELEKLCLQLHDEHWEEVEKYLSKGA